MTLEVIMPSYLKIRTSKLSSENHINCLCEKASQKLNALARIPYICPEKRKTVMKKFGTFQFGYCSLVWMFNNRGLHNKINYLYK